MPVDVLVPRVNRLIAIAIVRRIRLRVPDLNHVAPNGIESDVKGNIDGDGRCHRLPARDIAYAVGVPVRTALPRGKGAERGRRRR